jgi:hypothetical protein
MVNDHLPRRAEETGEKEIEVTPEMIKAGAMVLADRFEMFIDPYVEMVVSEIYSAMRQRSINL